MGPEAASALVESGWPCLLRPEGALRVVEDIEEGDTSRKFCEIRESCGLGCASLLADNQG